jgi:acetyl esterase/lipase
VVAVLSQRFLKEKLHQPKVTVFLYPWVQKVYHRLPSALEYENSGVLNLGQFTKAKLTSWYLGIVNVDAELLKIFENNEILGLIENEETQKQVLSYLDVDQIPECYKADRTYYKSANNIEQVHKLPIRLSESSLLRKDANMAQLFRNILKPSFSPLLADQTDLVGLPKAYFLIVECDSHKDEGLLYANRLRKVGVEVEIAFYENGFHGMAVMVKPGLGYQLARDMQEDLIQYLKSHL